MSRVNIPGVGLVDFPDDMSDSDITSAIKNNILKTGTAEPPVAPPVVPPAGKKMLGPEDNSSDYARALRNELPMLQEVGGAAQVIAGMGAKKLGATDTAKWLTEHGMQNMQVGNEGQVGKATDTFEGAWNQGIGSVVTDYLPYLAGQATASILETIGFSAAGAMLGGVGGAGAGAVPGAIAGAVSKQLVAKGVKDIAKNILEKEGKEAAEAYVAKAAAKELTKLEAKAALQTGAKAIGSNVGLGSQAIYHGMGEVGSRAIEEEQRAAQEENRPVNLENVDLGRVLPAATVHAIADFVVSKISLGGLKGISNTTTESILKDIFKQAGVTGLKEVPAEEIQTAAERYGAKLSLADAEAFKEYGETALASFVMGALPGGIGGARTYMMGTAADNKKRTDEENEKIKQQLTTYKPPSEEEITFTPEQAAILQPDTDENGNPLTNLQVDAPKIRKPTETTPVPAGNKVNEKPEDIANETFDVLTTDESNSRVAALEADNNRIQTKLSNGEYGSGRAVDNAKAKIARQQAEIDSLKPAAQETPAAKPAVQETPAPKESIYEVPKKEAADYVAAITSQSIKPNASILKKHIKALGLDVPAGAGFNERAIEAIKATLGGQNVIQQTNAPASGISAGVPGGPAATTNTPGATEAGLGRPGVASDQSAKLTPQDRTGSQQPTLTEEEQKAAAYAQSREALDQARLGPPERNEAFQTANLAEYQAQLEREQLAAQQTETARQEALQKVAGESIPQTKTDASVREEYELSRQAMAELGVEVPEWDNLKQDEKDKYLGLITTAASAQDYDNAIKTLAAYREQYKGSGAKPAEQRIINGYEENRKTFERSLGIDIPAWYSLSPEAQAAYTSNVKNNSPVEQDAGFEAVVSQLEKEGKGIRNVSREGVRNLQLKGAEQVSKAVAAERIAKEAAAEASAQGKGEALSEKTKAKLIDGDINGVLSDLISEAEGLKTLNLEKGDKTYRQAYTHLAQMRKRATALTFRIIAGSLNKLTFKSKVITDVNNKVIQRLEQEGKLAEYDPKTDTFYFTPGGFDEATVIHEIIHAGTVKVISQYLTNPSKLTKEQRDAAEHLQKIYDHSKKRLGNKFKNAYENMYEFISYAMTDNKFQIALAEMQVRPLAKYTAAVMSAWKQFTQALGKMFGLYDAKAQTEELTAEMYKEVAREYGSMDPNELYETLREEDVKELESLEIGDINSPNLWNLGEKVKETEVKVKKEKVYAKQARKFLTTFPGYEGNLLLETSEILSNILTSPKKGVNVAPLAARKRAVTSTLEPKLGESHPLYEMKADPGVKPIKFIWDVLKSPTKLPLVAKKFAHKKYYMRSYFRDLARSKKLIYEGDDINTVDELTTLSSGETRQFIDLYVSPLVEKLNVAVAKYAQTMGYTTDFALQEAHKITQAYTELDRSEWKYIFNVPLKEAKVLNNGTISPADRRDQIINFIKRDDVVLTKEQQLMFNKTLTALADKYADPMGKSPLTKTVDGKRTNPSVDRNSAEYNTTGFTKEKAIEIITAYENYPPDGKAAFDEIRANLKQLTEATKQLNRMANFWSQPVENIVGVMNYQNYVPLKGKGDVQHSEIDSMLNLEFDTRASLIIQDQLLNISTGKGREFQELPKEAKGRSTVSDNPILVSITDATKAAARAGRRNLTKAIMNCLDPDKEKNPRGQGLIKGHVKQVVKFADRDKINVESLKGETTLFHYDKNGDIVVMVIEDKKLRDSIRSTYEQANWATEWLNKVTSAIGKTHTRFNYNFAPGNFIRDAFTNAGLLSAEKGVLRGMQYVGAITAKIIDGGIAQSFAVSTLLKQGKFAQLARMAEKDPFVAEVLDHIKRGGNSAYIESMQLSSNFKNLADEVGRSGVKGYVLTKLDHVTRFLDNWNNMFELTSRVVARRVIREDLIARGAKEEEAAIRSAAAAKDLTNFEWVGDWGKLMGGLYMFFRPAAITAARAVEALAPGVRSMASAMRTLPPVILNDAQALENWKKEYSREAMNARITMCIALGGGMLAYGMAGAASPDDEDDRNKTYTDNMALWTRYARFHIPNDISVPLGLGRNVVFQIPWGFGLGAFAAMGAQIAAAGKGAIPWHEAFKNTATQIFTDSFLPIPVSRMDFGESPLVAVLDSVAPSFIRPAIELSWGKNGLGQDIIASTNSRFGDAYIGGDKVPAIYKDVSRWMLDKFEIDISPSAAYFLANSYIDGIAKLGEVTYGISDLQKSGREFNPKYDLPLFGSFFGVETDIDAREFASVEQQVLGKMRVYNQMATDPETKMVYEERHPFDPMIFKQFDYLVNGQLKRLETEAKGIRINKNYSASEKKDLLEVNRRQQNFIKASFVQTAKAYDIKP